MRFPNLRRGRIPVKPVRWLVCHRGQARRARRYPFLARSPVSGVRREAVVAPRRITDLWDWAARRTVSGRVSSPTPFPELVPRLL